MKKLMLGLLAATVMVMMLSSCGSVKRDCQGNKHYKQKGGFYM
jgi:hypothetical protein